MKTQAITSLPPSPEDDRRSRMIKYTVAMSIRVVCVVLLVFVRGWAMWIIAAGAIILPYIAVVLANVGNTPPQPDVERPGAIVPVGRPARFADEPASAGADTDDRASAEPGTDDRPSARASSAEERPTGSASPFDGRPSTENRSTGFTSPFDEPTGRPAA